MKSIEFKRSLLAAAVIGALAAAPAFADDNGARNSQSGDTAKMQGSDRGHEGRDADRGRDAMRGDRDRDDRAALQPCSSFKNPNAGKLADKDTGQAKEHSASPVHQDCL